MWTDEKENSENHGCEEDHSNHLTPHQILLVGILHFLLLCIPT